MFDGKFIFLVFLTGLMHEATGSTPDECVSNFRKAMLQRHNELRVKHGIPLMTESTSMNTVAQNYAETMASTGVFQHSGTSGVGENIAYIMKSSLTPTASTCFQIGLDMTNMWYNEIRSYNFAYPGYSSITGHLTQVIWKTSVELGMGIGVRNTNSFYGVAQYYKQGNIIGYFAGQANRPLY